MLDRRKAVPIATVAAVFLLGASSAFADLRVAVPTGGSGTACTFPAPCDIFRAVEFAANGDEVLVTPGTYDLGSDRLDLTVGATVNGPPGFPRPALLSTSATSAFRVNDTAAVVSDISVGNNGAGDAISMGLSGGTIERIIAATVGNNASPCNLIALPTQTAILRNSLCHALGMNSVAVKSSAATGGPSTLNFQIKVYNVTAVATGSGSWGIGSLAGDFSQVDVDAKNVIAQGAAFDAAETESATNSTATLAFAGSNYDSESDPNATITNPGTAGNQTGAPLLDANFRELAGSPTINGGVEDAALGTLELDRAIRRQGPMADIGAYEFDQIPPTVSITSGPAEGETIATPGASFGFTAGEPVGFECQVDAGPFGACSGPGASHTAAPLAEGAHSFSVRATDGNGNVSGAVTRLFAVDVPSDDAGGGDGGGDGGADRSPPAARITKGPKDKTEKSKAKFTFSADEPGSTFECKLDKGAYKACTSPRSYKNLDEAKHKFFVRATDAAGNTGSAVKDKWTVLG